MMNWNCCRAIQLHICIVPIILTSSFQHGRLIHPISGIHQKHHNSLPFLSIKKKTEWDTVRKVHDSSHYLGMNKSSQRLSRSSLRMVSYDDLMERLPSKAVIDAVEKSPSSSVVASDVAAAAGVSLSQARKDLTALASLSQGDIAVSKDGELIYSFPKQLNSVLSSNSLKFKIKTSLAKAWPPLFYAIRVSFGITLLVSIFAIFSTIALISSSSSDDDRRRSRAFGGGFWGPSPFDFFYYRPSYGYYGQPIQQRDFRDPEEMGLLESVFSYVFGDGNPNEGIEETQLRLISNLIRENNGAVTAEQIAPFLVSETVPKPDIKALDDVDSTRYVDESFVLPIVTKLNGEPRVTDDGDIVYVFPELQVSAQSDVERRLAKVGLPPDAPAKDIKNALIAKGVNRNVFVRGFERDDVLAVFEKAEYLFSDESDDFDIDGDSDLIQESEIEFSVAKNLNKILAGGFGALNLGGALYLSNLLTSPALYGVKLPSYFGLVQSGLPFLLGYAILYNAIPLARNFYIKAKNEKIKERNANRRLWRAQILASSTGRIARKLKEAKKMGTKMKQLGASGKGGNDDIVYDTRQSSDSIGTSNEKDALKDFDRLLDQE